MSDLKECIGCDEKTMAALMWQRTYRDDSLHSESFWILCDGCGTQTEAYATAGMAEDAWNSEKVLMEDM